MHVNFMCCMLTSHENGKKWERLYTERKLLHCSQTIDSVLTSLATLVHYMHTQKIQWQIKLTFNIFFLVTKVSQWVFDVNPKSQ